jgi:hypothetical protein
MSRLFDKTINNLARKAQSGQSKKAKDFNQIDINRFVNLGISMISPGETDADEVMNKLQSTYGPELLDYEWDAVEAQLTDYATLHHHKL